MFYRSLTTSLGTFSQQNRSVNMSSTTNGIASAGGSAIQAGTPSIENGSPVKRVNQNGTRSDFASILKKWSAPIPPTLSRKLGRTTDSPLGKVRISKISIVINIVVQKYLASVLCGGKFGDREYMRLFSSSVLAIKIENYYRDHNFRGLQKLRLYFVWLWLYCNTHVHFDSREHCRFYKSCLVSLW